VNFIMLLRKFVNTRYHRNLKFNVYDKLTRFIGSQYQAKTANFGDYTGKFG